MEVSQYIHFFDIFFAFLFWAYKVKLSKSRTLNYQTPNPCTNGVHSQQ